MLRRAWIVLLTGVVLVGMMALAPRPGVSATDTKEIAEIRLVLDGRTAGGFKEVSGLESEVEIVESICVVTGDGKDDDCDDVGGVQWQADLLAALWEIEAAGTTLEGYDWQLPAARHEVAKNAIQNMKGLAHEAAHVLQQQGGASLKTRHDTVKNAIGNIRAVYRVINSIAITESGVKSMLQELGSTIDNLGALSEQRTIRYSPGRPHYGNITLKAPLGGNPELWRWVNEVREGKTWRKSGSIIYLDRAGNEVLRYNFFEAWPVRWSADMAAEQVEIAVERIERTTR